MSLRLNRRDKELATALLVLGVIVVGFGSAELAVRWRQIAKFGFLDTVERSEKFHFDKETNLRLPVPGTRHGHIRFNSMGFRGGELDDPKPANRVRLLFLGASTTLDPYVEGDANTWPGVTVAALRSAFPSCRFDMANAGVPGMSTKHLATYFAKIRDKVKPDITMILTNDMNIRLNRVAQKKGLFGDRYFEPSWLAGYSLFWAKLELNAHVVSLERGADRTTGKLIDLPDEFLGGFEADLVALIRKLQDSHTLPVLLANLNRYRKGQPPDVRRAAVKSMLLYMPYMTAAGIVRVSDMYNASIGKIARRTGTPFIDSSDAVPGEPEFFSDSNHFSTAGAERAGQAAAAALARDPRVRAVIAAAGGGCVGSAGSRVN